MLFLFMVLLGVATVALGAFIGSFSLTAKWQERGAIIAIIGVLILLALMLL